MRHRDNRARATERKEKGAVAERWGRKNREERAADRQTDRQAHRHTAAGKEREAERDREITGCE